MTRLRLVASTDRPRLSAGCGKMSCANGFCLPVQPDRAAFLRWWSALIIRRCGSAHDVARLFDVTEQTGRNWIDGVACPTGLAVVHAMALWPEDFGRVAADQRVADRRVAA